MTRLILSLGSDRTFAAFALILSFACGFAMGAAYEMHWSAM